MIGSGNTTAVHFASGESDAMKMYIGGVSNAGMTVGLTINQGAADDEIITCKSSDVSHGSTDETEADTFFRVQKAGPNDGGALLEGFSDGSGNGIVIVGNSTGGDTTKSTSGRGVVELRAYDTDSSGGSRGGSVSNGNLVVIADTTNTHFMFDAEGQMHSQLASTTFSDGRLKTEQKECPYGLAEVNQLQPKWYKKHQATFNEDGSISLDGPTRDEIGFVAQDVKTLIPELVRDVDDESKSFYELNDGKLMAVLVKAVQELSEKVEAQQKEIEELKK